MESETRDRLRSVVGDIETVLGALNESKVRYLVAGGVAVVLQGYMRTTVDLDLVVELERENVERAVAALQDLGYSPRAPVDPAAFADAETRERWRRERGLRVFSMWNDSATLPEVDLFAEEPFDFDSTYERADRIELERHTIRVLAREDLMAMKRKSVRHGDRQDLEALEMLAEAESGSEGDGA